MIKTESGISEYDDKPAIIALCAIFIYNPLIVIGSVFSYKFFPFFRKFDMLLYLSLLFMIYFWAVLIKGLPVKRDMIIFPSFILLLWFISFVFYPENRPHLIMPLFYLVSQTLPAYFFSRAVHRYDLLLYYLKKVSVYIIIFAALSLFVKASEERFLEYNMVFSYVILIPVLVLISQTYNKQNIFVLIMAISGILIIFANGSRGASLSVAFFLLIFSIFNFRKRMSKYIILVSIILAFFILSKGFYDYGTQLALFLEDHGIKSRTLNKILLDQIGWDNGRLGFFTNSLDIFKNNLFFGLGMAGDRISIAKNFHTTTVSYSHNLFLELFVQYGFYIGSIFVISIFTIIFAGIKSCIRHNSSLKQLLLILLPVLCIKLMISSTYIAEIPFFILIALSINSITSHRYLGGN